VHRVEKNTHSALKSRTQGHGIGGSPQPKPSLSSRRIASMIIEVERIDNIPMMLNFSHVISVEPTTDPHAPVRICCSDGKTYEIKNSYDQLKEKCRRAVGPHA
jgi:hypothetical protein